ncbi:hypothetical protein Ac2012v2_004587 [Leucoagaricus gongylophorus]
MFRSRPSTGPWVCPSVHAPPVLPSTTYDIPSYMASSPPAPQNSRKSATRTPHKSPAQAIADAWKRESPDSQEIWRKWDAETKRQFEEAQRKRKIQSKM